MKVALVTDSTFYMDKSLLEKYKITQVPLSINFDDAIYNEDQYNEEQKVEIFDKIQQTQIIPKTSQPTPEAWEQCFYKLEEQGYDKILIFTVSTEISGTFYGAQAASKMYMETHPNVSIEVYDTASDGNGSSLVLFDVIEQMELEQRVLTPDEIVDIINWHKEMLQIYLIVDDLKYLAYGGRIPKTIASIGNSLRIKPLIKIPAGKLTEYGKCFSRKKAIKTICELMQEYSNKYQDMPIYFTGAYLFVEEEALNYAQMIKQHASNEIIDIPFASFGSAIGDHVGPNSIGYAWSIPYKYKDMVKDLSN